MRGPTPMFPLGVVHFPHVGLPLRVFEPRYRQMTIDCLNGAREFGVVLIERGSEVGGGDTRFDVATMTSIRQARVADQAVILLDTVGTRRVRVTRWLPDDPYPRAEVEDFPTETVGDAEREAIGIAEKKVRRALALCAELDEPTAPYNVVLDEAPERAIFQLAAIAPIGPADKQRLLSSAPLDLLRLLADFMDDQLSVLAQRLAGS